MAQPAPRALQRYRDKRKFDRTPEPAGVARASTGALEFVIQRHHARRLHYDFRLEWDGVLKSWAVPKGPSLDPGEKRLAVQVEDHPFEYRHFSGDIPAGQYGAGHVVIWDRGHWQPEGDVEAGLARGKLDFSLDGERLHGRWSLVRLRDEKGDKVNWLLLKRRDEHAQRHAGGPDVTELYSEPLATNGRTRGAGTPRANGTRAARTSTRAAPRSRTAAFLEPQLATAVEAAPETGEWLTELKFDGYRLLAHVDGESARCFTRSGLDWTHRLPAIATALAATGLRDAWLDGELVAVDARGVPQFQQLQQALDAKSGDALRYLVFDALRLEGADLRDKPQRERKRLLQQSLAELSRGAVVRLADFVDGDSAALRTQACELGFEGVILKDAEAPYRAGRNRSWLKLKCRREQEFVVAGYTRTSAGRGTLTALLLGYYDDAGKLHFAGRAGTGFSERQLADLRKRLDALAVDGSPFADAAKLRGKERPVWARPKLVAQVRFAEWTDSGLLRQPLFLGLREDKRAREVKRETIALTPALSRKAGEGAKAPSRSRKAAEGARALTPTLSRETGEGVKLTNPQRVLYPTDGITKAQLAAYYEAIAPVLWPHLQARPLSLIRATSTQGRVFFQRHADRGALEGLKPVAIPESDEQPYFACASEASIPTLAQMGAVELHTWGSRLPRPTHADRLTFDLDPDPALPWPRVREAATLVRELLQALGLEPLLKTSGGAGLHLVVPIVRGPPMDVAAAFARRVAEHLARLMPQRFSARRGAPNRKGRVYVDWQRNQLAATTVAAYSPRHRPGVPVSMPIDWDELGARDLRGAHFNLRNAVARIAAEGDAWQRRPAPRQSLTQSVIRKLEAAA